MSRTSFSLTQSRPGQRSDVLGESAPSEHRGFLLTIWSLTNDYAMFCPPRASDFNYLRRNENQKLLQYDYQGPKWVGITHTFRQKISPRHTPFKYLFRCLCDNSLKLVLNSIAPLRGRTQILAERVELNCDVQCAYNARGHKMHQNIFFFSSVDKAINPSFLSTLGRKRFV